MAQDADTPGGRLVIVEDDGGTRRALGRLLERNGYAPIGFPTVAAAARWVEEDWGGGGAILGVVIDVHLPDGDGIDLTKRLRRKLGDRVPIVVVSGDTSLETLRRLDDAGATRFVAKPISLRVLQDALGHPSAPDDALSNHA